MGFRECQSLQGSVRHLFTCHEFSYNKIAEAYEPYLGLIRQMFHRYCSGTLEEFMEECDVYKLQRPVFESYLKGILRENGTDPDR